jgi:hypothetical protein
MFNAPWWVLSPWQVPLHTLQQHKARRAVMPTALIYHTSSSSQKSLSDTYQQAPQKKNHHSPPSGNPWLQYRVCSLSSSQCSHLLTWSSCTPSLSNCGLSSFPNAQSCAFQLQCRLPLRVLGSGYMSTWTRQSNTKKPSLRDHIPHYCRRQDSRLFL